MKKLTKKQIENLKTGVIIVFGIIIVIGLIFIVSNNTGNNTYTSSNNNSSSSSNSQNESTNNENPLLEEGEEINEEDMGELTDISYTDLESMIKNHDKKIVMLGTEQCGWCLYQKPVLRKIVKDYDVEINYLNLGNLSSEDSSKLSDLHEDLASFGTPTFIVVEDGEVTVVDSGARGTSAMVEFLKTNGFISE